jgi:NTE family protein
VARRVSTDMHRAGLAIVTMVGLACGCPSWPARAAEPPAAEPVAAVNLAATPSRPAPATARPRIGLVLSGGGARGLAHVGVLKVLERERIPVDVIAGTSMGAIVGGLYASGLSAAEVESEVRKLDWDNVFASRVDRRELSQRRKEQDFEVSPLIEVGVGADGIKAPLGSLSSRVLEAQLRRLTLGVRQDRSFDDLPTPFRAVATDMETGQAVILKDGDLATALRSSMSVPGVFAPVPFRGRILGDGGLVDNTPVDVARAMGADILIVVNVGTPLAPRDTLGTLTGVTTQMINILTEQNVQRSLDTLSPRDVLITPPLQGISSADFNRAQDIVSLGQIQAEALAIRLQDLRLNDAAYAEWLAARHRHPAVVRGALEFVRFEGTQLTHPENRADMLRSQPGEPFDVAKAERDVNLLAASGDYQRTDYRLAKAPDGGEGLVFELTDKVWGPNYLQVGLDFSADNRGRSIFNLKLVHNRHWLDASGMEWRNFLRLGTSPIISTELYRPMNWILPDGLAGFVAGGLSSQRQKLSIYDDPNGALSAEVERRMATLKLDAGVNWRELGEWRLGWFDQEWRDAANLASADSALAQAGHASDVMSWRERGWHTKAVFDQLDHAFFPQHGWRLEGDWTVAQRVNRSADDGPEGFVRHFEGTAQAVHSWGDHTVQVFGHMGLSGGATPIVPRYGLGGFQQLSGYAPFQVSGQQVALMRLGYYVRLADMPMTRGLVAGASVETGNAWARTEDLWKGRKRTGETIYLGADTALGPVYTALAHSPGQGFTVMLFVGRP